MKNKNIIKDNTNVVLIFILIILLSGISVILFIANNKEINNISDNSKEDIELFLLGDTEINLNVGEKYIEPGYYAITKTGILKTDEVIVIPNTIDTNISGTYYINYVIKNKILKRKVNIIAKLEERNLDIVLNGNDTIYLNLGEEYIEPGYKAFDSIDGDLTNFVKVSGTINTLKEGKYILTYEIKNSNLDIKIKKRTIIVK